MLCDRSKKHTFSTSSSHPMAVLVVVAKLQHCSWQLPNSYQVLHVNLVQYASAWCLVAVVRSVLQVVWSQDGSYCTSVVAELPRAVPCGCSACHSCSHGCHHGQCPLWRQSPILLNPCRHALLVCALWCWRLGHSPLQQSYEAPHSVLLVTCQTSLILPALLLFSSPFTE